MKMQTAINDLAVMIMVNSSFLPKSAFSCLLSLRHSPVASQWTQIATQPVLGDSPIKWCCQLGVKTRPSSSFLKPSRSLAMALLTSISLERRLAPIILCTTSIILKDCLHRGWNKSFVLRPRGWHDCDPVFVSLKWNQSLTRRKSANKPQKGTRAEIPVSPLSSWLSSRLGGFYFACSESIAGRFRWKYLLDVSVAGNSEGLIQFALGVSTATCCFATLPFRSNPFTICWKSIKAPTSRPR